MESKAYPEAIFVQIFCKGPRSEKISLPNQVFVPAISEDK